MTGSPVLKRLLDTGMQFGEMSQKNAEKLVDDFVKAGQMRRKDAEKTVQQLVERGRATTEHVVSVDPGRGRQAARQVRRAPRRRREPRRRRRRQPRPRLEEVAAKKAPGEPVRQGQSRRRQEGRGQARLPAKKAAAKKAAAKKAASEEGCCQEGSRRRRPPPRRRLRSSSACRGACGSTPRWCAADWCSAAPRRRGRSTQAWCWSTVRSPTSRRGWSTRRCRGRCRRHRPRFVSRGGEKLDAALDAFARRRHRAAGARRRRLDRRVHRLPAAARRGARGGRRRRPRPAAPEDPRRLTRSPCSSDSTFAISPPTRSVARSTSSSPTCRSSRSFVSCRR